MRKAAAAVVKGEGRTGEVSVTLTDDRNIRALNRKYRKIDRATDVLSFGMDEKKLLGDVVISVETAARNAKRYGVEIAEEMARLVVHGTLHLLGFDHGGKSDRMQMRQKEDLYAKKVLREL